MPGFWSSSLFADITLVVQILFYLVLCAGVVAQLQESYKWHDRLQIPVVVLNIFFIIFVMLPTFRSVAGELPAGITQVPTLVTVIHATLGAIAQLLAIYCLLAGLKILPRKIGRLRYWMWAAFTAWTATVIFGIGVYMTFYLSPVAAASGGIVTEHDADLVSEHAEPVGQPSTEEAAPAPTEEAVTEHAQEPVDAEPQPAAPEPTEEVVAEHDAEAALPEPPQSDESAAPATQEAAAPPPTDQPASEPAEAVAEDVAEPQFTGQSGQAQWQAVTTTNAGPGPRYEHAMQYNPATNQMFLFGGRDGTQTFNDVWALDVESFTWRQVAANAPVAPPARFSTVMIVDDAGQNLYVATGHTQDGQNFNDVWKLDLSTESWTDLTATAGPAPTPRYGAPGGNLGGNLVTTHGFGDTRYDDTWRFNVDTEQWENISPDGPRPLRRCLFAAAPVNNTGLVMHGGCASGFGDCFLDDTWILDTGANAWSQVLSDVKPVGRQYQSLVAAGPEQVLLFGGQDATRAARNDVWSLNLASGSWQPVEAPNGPEARYQHAAVWIPGRGMLVYGGRNSGPLGDLWLLSLSSAPAEQAPAPEPTPPPEPTPVPEPTPTPELISEHDGG